MKKLLFILMLASPAYAGTGTFSFGSGGGTITISSGSASTSGTTYTYQQNKECSASSYTIGCAFTGSVTAHSLLVVGCTTGFASQGINTVLITDTQGDVFSTAAVVANGNGGGAQETGVYYTMNAIGGANTVTCHDLTNTATSIQLVAHEYLSNGAGSFDVASSSSTSASIANPVSGNLTTTLSNEFVFAFASPIGGTTTGASGTTRYNSVDYYYAASEDAIVSSPSSYQSTFTQGTIYHWAMIQAAFK
jgi:hypothetical protein